MCIGGGGGVNVNTTDVGHVIFFRNTHGAEKEKFWWFQDTILIPEINDHHQHHDNFDAYSGLEIPETLTAVS